MIILSSLNYDFTLHRYIAQAKSSKSNGDETQ